MEKRSIILGKERVEYTLIRKKVKRISIRVRGGGEVLVTVPQRRPLTDAEAFILEKSEFVLAAIEKLKDVPNSGKAQSYTDGMTLKYLGTDITLHIIEGARNKVTQEGDVLTVMQRDKADSAVTARLIERWMGERCRDIVTEIFEEVYPQFAKMGVARPTAMRFRMMTSRWGSNSSRTNALTFNSRLVGFPREVIKHVVLHELCHYIHHDHSKAFYALLDSVDPKRREHERCLGRRR